MLRGVMALLYKLFSSKKCNSKQENISENVFSKDQIRMVLFRECDFRGRKLLFDSSAIKKEPIFDDTISQQNEKFVEISDGFGYSSSKAPSDCRQLSDMIFGLISMSFRGNYFKIHKMEDPPRLMFTQVFPCPKFAKSKNSLPSRIFLKTSSQSLDHSIKLEDSSTSTNSISENSEFSTASDTVLVCRKVHHSNPLDVPQKPISISNPSNIGDSGFIADHFSSFDSVPPFPNCSQWDSFSFNKASASSIYKKWLRSTSTSLENSYISLNGSTEDHFSYKQNNRLGKLGAAFIIELNEEKNCIQTQLLMENFAIIESMLWRCRKTIESSLLRPNKFVSTMCEISSLLQKSIIALMLSNSSKNSNLWTNFNLSSNLLNNCDTSFKKNAFSQEELTWSQAVANFSAKTRTNFSRTCSFLYKQEKSDSVFNLPVFVKNELDIVNSESINSDSAFLKGKFVEDFALLLEILDEKRTNFFFSTLLTAILTHHLGWVSTVLPIEENITTPYNPLWGQLCDLFGAIGHPTKMCQTVVCGNNAELITKILIALTYFIRCCNIERNILKRKEVDEENKTADNICKNESCLPKENFKKYQDHLKEIDINNKASDILVKTEGKPKGLSKKNNVCMNLLELDTNEDENIQKNTGIENEKVVFVLGENDALVNLKQDNKQTENSSKPIKIIERPKFLDIVFKKYESFESEYAKNSIFKDEHFTKNDTPTSIKPSTSFTDLKKLDNKIEIPTVAKEEIVVKKAFVRAASEPPESTSKEVKEQTKAKYKYSGIKFKLHQYPQVVTNYMRNKNLEMANLSFADKAMKFNRISFENEGPNLDFSQYEANFDDTEALQTPSNASDLEFSSDFTVDIPKRKHARESAGDVTTSNVTAKNIIHVPNTISENCEEKCCLFETSENKMKMIHFPLPKSETQALKNEKTSYVHTIFKGTSNTYLPDMVLQGTTLPKIEWEYKLKSDLALSSQHCLLDQPIDEAVAIVANTDTWDVQLISSHTYVIDKVSSGIRVGMSQLVANMLESFLRMTKLRVPPQFCLLHIEHRLQELCVLSKAMAQLLLSTELCNMEFLTSSLQLEVNDIPLLMAVASIHSPHVTEKYGLSFQ